MIFWGLALCQFVQLISFFLFFLFFFFCNELHLLVPFLVPLPHSCTVNISTPCCPSPQNQSPALSPWSCAKVCFVVQRPQRLPITWQTPSPLLNGRNIRTVCFHCALCLFYKALTDLVLTGDGEGQGKETSSQNWAVYFWCCWLSQSSPAVVFVDPAAGLAGCWWASLIAESAFSSSAGRESKILCSNDLLSSYFHLLGVMVKETNYMGSGCCTRT